MTNLWCEIDFLKMAGNIERIRQKTDKKIFAVVKCNAYGLGIEEITRFLDDKVDGFVVSDIEEALKVQSLKPILILLPKISDIDIPKIKDHFILTVDHPDMLEKLTGRPYTVHIYVDTGMHRFGVKPDKANELIKKIREEYPNITIDGIYSHLNHPKNNKYTRKQLTAFEKVVQKHRLAIPNIHVLNSRGFLNYSELGFDSCLRVGSLIYGSCGQEHGYKKVFSCKTRLVSSSCVDRNQYIGYGNRYKTKKRTQIGILAVGFIHGFHCSRNIKAGILYSLARIIYHFFKKEHLVFYNGKSVAILGGSSMNFTMVNLDGFPVEEGAVFDIDLSSVLADGLIPKRYLEYRGEQDVQL